MQYSGVLYVCCAYTYIHIYLHIYIHKCTHHCTSTVLLSAEGIDAGKPELHIHIYIYIYIYI